MDRNRDSEGERPARDNDGTRDTEQVAPGFDSRAVATAGGAGRKGSIDPSRDLATNRPTNWSDEPSRERAEDLVGDLAAGLMKAKIKVGLFRKPAAATRVGRFVLLDRIAAGGMGEVYAAYDERLDRKVAIKLVRPDIETPDNTASMRLLREAQTLARLAHPNVVPVYEAGIFGDRVFLAMEFVRGVTLQKWVEDHGGKEPGDSWRAILSKYIDAGRGLQAVHDAGLVHRDFKPENVLVGSDGRVRIVDFGLAYVESGEELAAPDVDTDTDADQESRQESGPQMTLGSELGRTRPVTRGDDGELRLQRVARLTATGALVGTPAYMSPEQLDSREVDARSDQFSFCVALYEALCGTRPFAGEDLASIRALQRSGVVTPPPRSSPVPPRIWSAIARGLSYSRGERHRDMDELLGELSWTRSRRRQWVAAAALGTAMITVGILALSSSLSSSLSTAPPPDPCLDAGDRVDQIWNRETRDAIQASFRATGLAHADDAFDAVERGLEDHGVRLRDDYRAACVATRIRQEQSDEILALRIHCLDRRALAFDGAIRGLAAANDRLVDRGGYIVAGLPALESCRDGELLSFGVEPPEDPAVAAQVAEIRRALAEAMIHHQAGRPDQALALVRSRVAAAETSGYAPVRAEALYTLGSLLLEQPRDGRHDSEQGKSGDEILLEAVDLAESHRHDELASDGWNRLLAAAIDRRSTSLDVQRARFRRALASSARVGDGGRRRALALSLIGRLHARRGDLTGAERQVRQSLEMTASVGVSDQSTGQLSGHESDPLSGHESGQLAGRMASATARRLPPLQEADHRVVLAGILRARSQFDGARESYEQALTLYRSALGSRHVRIAEISLELGSLLHRSGELGQARDALNVALAIWNQRQGAAYRDAARAHLALGALERESGDLQSAEKHANSARTIYLQILDPGDLDQAEPEILLGILHVHSRRFEDALASFQRALVIAENHDSDQRLARSSSDSSPRSAIPGKRHGKPHRAHRLQATARARLAAVWIALGAIDRALGLLARAERDLESAGDRAPTLSALILHGRGQAHLVRGDTRGAIAALEDALTLLLSVPGRQLERADVQWALARALLAGPRRSADAIRRARALAEGARSHYARHGRAGDGLLGDTVRAIDAWLADHPAASAPDALPR